MAFEAVVEIVGVKLSFDVLLGPLRVHVSGGLIQAAEWRVWDRASDDGCRAVSCPGGSPAGGLRCGHARLGPCVNETHAHQLVSEFDQAFDCFTCDYIQS